MNIFLTLSSDEDSVGSCCFIGIEQKKYAVFDFFMMKVLSLVSIIIIILFVKMCDCNEVAKAVVKTDGLVRCRRTLLIPYDSEIGVSLRYFVVFRNIWRKIC